MQFFVRSMIIFLCLAAWKFNAIMIKHLLSEILIYQYIIHITCIYLVFYILPSAPIILPLFAKKTESTHSSAPLLSTIHEHSSEFSCASVENVQMCIRDRMRTAVRAAKRSVRESTLYYTIKEKNK